MANPQPVKMGISSGAVRNIPKEWDSGWFRAFITHHMQNMDIRNTIAGPGIVITGTEQLPGTISTTAPYPQTPIEAAAGVVPVNIWVLPGNVLRYGTNTTPGTTDMTAAFAALALTGYVGYAPGQKYLISSAITWLKNGSGLTGDGISTQIITNSTTADIFVLGNGSTTFNGGTFSNFGVWASTTKSAGAAFNCRFASETVFTNVYAGSQLYYINDSNTNRLFNGYIFNHFNLIQINGGQVYYQNYGLECWGDSADTGFGDELTLDAGLTFLGGSNILTSIAVYCAGNAGGVYLGRVSISAVVGYGLYTDYASTALAYPNREIFIGPECTIDSCTNFGISIGGSSVALLEMCGAWVCGNGTTTDGYGGMVVGAHVATGTTPEIKINGCRIAYNLYDGLQFSDGAVTITGNVIANNGTQSVGGHGILIAGITTLPFTMTGNYVANNGNNTRGYGLSITSGSEVNFNIQANTLYGNGQGGTTGQINDPAANSTTAIIRNNVGYLTENIGTCVPIATGATVTHGLSEVPTNVFVQQIDGTPTGVYVSAVGATTFVINYAGGGTHSFNWRATIGFQ